MKLDDVVCRQPLSYFLVVIFLFFFVSSYRAFIFSYLVIYLCILFQSFHRTLAWFPRFHMSGHNHGHSGVRRIMRELKELNAEQSDMYTVQPHESNVFELHFTLRGGPGTEFHGGLYHGKILLPTDYPYKPPDILFLTPSGRFETHKKICLSISSYHPEQWVPSWGIAVILTATLAFMTTPGNGAIGAIDTSHAVRKQLAIESQHWSCPVCQKTNQELFPRAQELVQKELLEIETREKNQGKDQGKDHQQTKKENEKTQTDKPLQEHENIPTEQDEKGQIDQSGAENDSNSNPVLHVTATESEIASDKSSPLSEPVSFSHLTSNSEPKNESHISVPALVSVPAPISVPDPSIETTSNTVESINNISQPLPQSSFTPTPLSSLTLVSSLKQPQGSAESSPQAKPFEKLDETSVSSIMKTVSFTEDVINDNPMSDTATDVDFDTDTDFDGDFRSRKTFLAHYTDMKNRKKNKAPRTSLPGHKEDDREDDDELESSSSSFLTGTSSTSGTSFLRNRLDGSLHARQGSHHVRQNSAVLKIASAPIMTTDTDEDSSNTAPSVPGSPRAGAGTAAGAVPSGENAERPALSRSTSTLPLFPTFSTVVTVQTPPPRSVFLRILQSIQQPETQVKMIDGMLVFLLIVSTLIILHCKFITGNLDSHNHEEYDPSDEMSFDSFFN